MILEEIKQKQWLIIIEKLKLDRIYVSKELK
jgi:hypothetical protein